MICIGVGSQLVQIAGSSVLLTGAAGGIGHAVARALHARGATLILSDRRAEVLEPLAVELGARALVSDLSDRVSLERLLDDTGAVDILVANAALPATGLLESFSIEEIDRALEVNLRAPIVLARALLAGMLERDRGHLLFMSSLAGKAPAPGASMYSASKAGLRGFTAGLRRDLHGSGVGVSAVFPGFIRDAGMFAETEVELPKGVGTRTPRDVARAVVTAIERNRGEIDVAPLGLRAAAILTGVAPELASSLSRRLGSNEVSGRISARQRDKR
jgi:short-subunit dehydrogenase